MNADEARAHFSDALEDLLDGSSRQAFDQALAEDPALAREYEAFARAVALTRALGRETAGDDGPPTAPAGVSRGPRGGAPDVLRGVQRKLRRRSRGRYYRDAFAEGVAPRALLVSSVLALVLLALVLGVAALVLPWAL